MTTGHWLAVAISLAIGLIAGAIWSRWRAQVVRELRAVRSALATEQLPELQRIVQLLQQQVDLTTQSSADIDAAGTEAEPKL